MKLSENYIPGAAIAAWVLNEKLLSLLMKKGLLSRDETFELLETALLSLEQMQSHFEALLKRDQFESYLKAARFQLEATRVALNTQHPAGPSRP